jgi:hypothetical protein
MRITVERIILAGLIVIYLLLLMPYINQLKSLPSPLYGGDYYHQLGQIYHMYESSPLEWFSTSNGLGERPAYFPVYGILVTIFGKIFGLGPFYAMVYFNFIALPLSALIAFMVMKEVLKSEALGLIGVILFFTNYGFPIFKYTEFTKWIATPLFFYFLYKFYEKVNMKNAVLLGLAYGMMGLSHSTAFVFATFAVIAVGGYILWKGRKLDAKITENKKNIALAWLLGFVIAQIYWFGPIFIYHGSNELKSNIWSLPDYGNFDYALRAGWEMFSGIFLNFASLLAGIKSLVILCGVYLIVSRRTWKENAFAIILFAVSFALTYSYFLTMPLFGNNFAPSYCADLYLNFSALLVGVSGIKEIFERYEKSKMIIYGAIALLAILSIMEIISILKANESSQWFGAGKEELPVYLKQMQEWVLKKTNVNDVILSNNEISFAVNGLTGRKIVVSRRAHNDAFMQDFDDRQIDAAVIFYGNDDRKRMELLKKYNVKYVYYEAGWYSLEFYFDENGKLVGYGDPLMVVYSEEKESELKKYGIKYFKTRGWLDPAVRGLDVRMYDVLIVSPENYDNSGYGPWNDGLDKYLEKVWSYEQNGRVYAALYEVSEV